MRKVILVAMILIVFVLLGCGSAIDTKTTTGKQVYQVVDIKGTIVTMPEKPKRIITLATSTDGIILGMLPTENLVALNALMDDPVSSNMVTKAKK